MPRTRRKENKGLPSRWRRIHGAYYYDVPPGLEGKWDGKKLFRLASTLPEAYRVWAVRIETIANARTIDQLLDRYALEIVPTKAPKTKTENSRHVAALRKVFGDMLMTDLKPQMVYQYVDKRSAKVAAHREIEVLSHAFTKAVEWGYMDRHPFKGEVRLAGEKPRDRYVEDWEVVECLALESHRKKGSVLAIQAYIRIKLMTGMSRGDLLRLQPSRHFKDDGIHIQRHKTATTTGKRTIYNWTPELRDAVQKAMAARPVDISPFPVLQP